MSIWHPLTCNDDPRTVNWATANIGPHPLWLEHARNKDRPDILHLAKEAIARSGRDPGTIDLVEVMTGFINILIAQAKRNFQEAGYPEAVGGLEAVDGRADLSIGMIWDYFTHWGPAGAAVHIKAAEMLSSEDAINTSVALIREGRYDVR